MISINQCKEILGDSNFSDEQITEVRDILYAMVEQVFDEYESADVSNEPRHD